MSSNNFLKRNDLTTKHNPVFNLYTDINNLFDEFLDFGTRKTNRNINSRFVPALEILENPKSFKINLELPGIEKEHIDISMRDGRIIIKCKKEDKMEEKKESYLLKETYHGIYERSINVPNTADLSTADAKFDNGILSITIDKKTESVLKEKKLEIK